MRTLSLVLPVALVATLGVANLLVSPAADADALPDEPAPVEIPAGAALTGLGLVSQAQVHGLIASLDVKDRRPELVVSNPGEAHQVLVLRGKARFSSGNPVGRMGPMTFEYEAVEHPIALAPGQSVRLALTPEPAVEARLQGGRAGRNRVAVQPEPIQEVAAINVRALNVNDVPVRTPADGEELVDVGDNTPLYLNLNQSFETWTVQLSVGDEAPATLVASL